MGRVLLLAIATFQIVLDIGLVKEKIISDVDGTRESAALAEVAGPGAGALQSFGHVNNPDVVIQVDQDFRHIR
jgi:hypothetical protein